MIDLITVVHRPEMPFLELQAKSIETYFEDNFVNSIQVVVNDDDSVCDLINKAWWGKYQDRVNIVPYSLYNYKCRVNGWENQQLCKLLAASQSQQTWAIIRIVRNYWGARSASTASIGTRPQRFSFSFPALM